MRSGRRPFLHDRSISGHATRVIARRTFRLTAESRLVYLTQYYMRKRPSLVRALLAATTSMVQGGLSETSRRCGKSTCQCHRDRAYRHGPHLYLTYREDEVSRSLYVPPAHAAAARAAHDAWASFWTIGCALAAVNREQLRRQWQREPRARTSRVRRRPRHD